MTAHRPDAGGEPRLDPALLVAARAAAWRAASWYATNPGDMTGIGQDAGPLAAWMAQAPDDDDLQLRIDAVRRWTRAVERLAGNAALPGDDRERLPATVRGIYEWLTDVPGYGQAHPGAPAPAMSAGRHLFIYRCLLEHATAETPGRPAMDPAELISGAWRRANSGQLRITRQDISDALAVMYRGDPRRGTPGRPPGAPQARLGAPRGAVVRGGLGSAGAGEVATPAKPGPGAGGQPEADVRGPFGPPGEGPAAAGPAW